MVLEKNFVKKVLTFVGTGGKITHVLERQDKTSSGTVVRTTGTEKKFKKVIDKRSRV